MGQAEVCPPYGGYGAFRIRNEFSAVQPSALSYSLTRSPAYGTHFSISLIFGLVTSMLSVSRFRCTFSASASPWG